MDSSVPGVAQLNTSQPPPFKAVEPGPGLELELFIPVGGPRGVWYKLTAEKGLQCVIKREYELIYFCSRYDERPVYIELVRWQ